MIGVVQDVMAEGGSFLVRPVPVGGGMKQSEPAPSSATDYDEQRSTAAYERPSSPHDETPPCYDDGVEANELCRDPDYAEERFRVDRRKLEQLIQGRYLLHDR